jgi:amino acid adenylation domain-containing protein
MMINAFLSYLRNLDIKIWAEEGQIRVRAPKGVLTPALKEELSKRKIEILHFLGDSTHQISTSLTPITPTSRAKDLKPSYGQERLWFLDKLEPGSSAYNMFSALRLIGQLNVPAIEDSLRKVIRRHEILRSSFPEIDGRPVVRILAEEPFLLQVIDLGNLLEFEKENQARLLAQKEAQHTFNLAQGPLFRAILVRINSKDQVLFLNVHHIVFDGWSYNILMREFSAFYKSFVNGQPADLPALPIQYVDYAHWQREWLEGEALESLLAYWKEKLGGELPELQLATDRPRPAIQTFRGASESLTLPQSLTEAVRSLSRREGVTTFMTLLAAFKTLLFRLTGQDDILVGTPIAGRNRVEVEPLIGFFINTCVMRTVLSGHPTFRGLLTRVRETALGAYAHQDMPFEKLVDELVPRRDLSRTPLFQIFFNHINLSDHLRGEDNRLELSGLKIESFGDFEFESKYDMTLYVWEEGGTITLTSSHNADLFKKTTIAQMLEQYQELLRQIADKPEERIAQYSLLTPSQRNQLPDPTGSLTKQWTGSVHERFSEQARHVPEHTAIVDSCGTWSYGEIERYSSHLGGHLRSKGVQSGDIIAIYGQRSAGLVLALLGVLKAGAAFLILDPGYPASRLIKMLEESMPSGWLKMETAGPVADELGTFVEASGFLCRLQIPQTKRAVEDLLKSTSPEPPEDRVAPDDTAYITFTSGTTGRPKGIIGTHRPLAHFLEWHCRQFDLKGSDRFSMLSGLSHDPLLRDIFTPLWLGATLCIPDPDEMLIPDKLRAWMKKQQITVAHMTPALGQLLSEAVGIAEARSEELSALRYVFFGGDALTRQHVERMRQLAPGVVCVNYYGATETPQAMAYNVVDMQERDKLQESIPLGKGIEGVQLLVLNAAHQLSGIGELGEIFIRTPYLTKGYLNDETLTRERFIPNLFNGVPGDGDRLYKTGDLGRYLPDGRVMFYGRGDGQVSIRGFRVELKEIEAILGRHSDIRDCAVVARDKNSGDRYLAAYVVGQNSIRLDPLRLTDHVGKHLPNYMIPSVFVELDELPLTPNGKVDVPKLIQMERPPSERLKVPNEPLTEMEEMLIAIWKEVLSLDHISVQDNFFEVGGHSLLSIQVISRLEKRIGLRINPREFIYQTLGQLAASIERQKIDASKGGQATKKKGLWHAIKQKVSSIGI